MNLKTSKMLNTHQGLLYQTQKHSDNWVKIVQTIIEKVVDVQILKMQVKMLLKC